MIAVTFCCGEVEFASKIQPHGYSHSCSAIQLAKVVERHLLAILATIASLSIAQMLNSCSCREAASVWGEEHGLFPGCGLLACSAKGAEDAD